jgi:hypothetical protein
MDWPHAARAQGIQRIRERGEQDLGDIDFVRCSPQGKGEIKKNIGDRTTLSDSNTQ